MKKIYLILSILIVSVATSWAQEDSEKMGNCLYMKSGNPFDGEYYVVGVNGKGGDFPYEDPMLIVRYMSDELNVFISDCGYFIDEPQVQFIFDDESTRFEPDFGLSTDKKALFLSNLNGEGKVNTMIDKMLTAKQLFVQVKTKDERYIITYDLNGFKEAYAKLEQGMK